ncbi:MAG: choline ABC transporter ATP-binding protein [Deltaproteobacteria bacterium]|nr:MAG: choline ABC transporter ATP-binding protein [Deltaproteobacteria bacterium]
MKPAIEFEDVDILFPREQGRAGKHALKGALAALDAGGTRDQISEQHGVVVGVQGANLSVARGEICVLMGLSGSGKSTLLRAANGLNPVTRGRVLVDGADGAIDVAGCDAATLRRLRRERVSMVFQHFGLLPWRTVADNVALALELRGEDAAAVKRVVADKLEVVGLTEWADRPVKELSGGMQQRVGLARALTTEADILLMDEPFSALDPLIRGKLQDELLALQEQVQRTILFVSHDLDEALRIGDRIAIMESGRIVQTGTAQDIVLHPASEYVSEFVRHMNPLTVVNGATVMRPLGQIERADGALFLDEGRRYRLDLAESGAPRTLWLDGTPLELRATGEEGEIDPDDRAAIQVPETATLRTLIRLRQVSGHPVLLTDGGALVGVCGDAELIRALDRWAP